VHLVLNAPVTANRLGQNLRRSESATEVIAPFPRGLPVPGFGREGIGSNSRSNSRKFLKLHNYKLIMIFYW
jgi:hypothetical protein